MQSVVSLLSWPATWAVLACLGLGWIVVESGYVEVRAWWRGRNIRGGRS